jgi:uncharacterized repeat protein (TIGR01451 family)
MAKLISHDLGYLSALAAALILSLTGFPRNSTPAFGASSEPASIVTSSAETNRAQRLVANLPVYFIENQGQLDRRAAYYVHGSDKVIYFTAGGLTIVLQPPRRQAVVAQGVPDERASDHPVGVSAQRLALQLEFVGADLNVLPSGENPSTALISYFKGRPDEWKSAVKSFTRLVYADLWPGIDLIFTGAANQLKYLFVVRPGADPGAIQLRYRGADSIGINSAGQLEVRTLLGDLKDEKPTAYQEANLEGSGIEVAYDLRPSSGGDSNQYGFKLANYDDSLPLILDPALLVYSTFIGGSGDDRGNAIAVDSDGNAYITGETNSLETSFPTVAGPDRNFNGNVDAFVAKLNAAGTALIYAGFIGGTGDDRGKAIAVDSGGNAYITGDTTSTQISFPVITGPDLTHNGATDAFVAKVNASGTALSYAGFIGGSAVDQGNAIAVDGSNRAYVAGSTLSQGVSFPSGIGFGALTSFDVLENGGVDGFVVRVAPDGAALEYASYIGGVGDDRVFGVAVDGAGAAYLTGETNSNGLSFPVMGSLDSVQNGGVDAFVAKVNPAGTALVYAGFVGGGGEDRGKAIAIVPGCPLDCDAYIAGETSSTELSFPVTGGPDLIHNGGIDGFVAKINAAGTALIYAGYIGGVGTDRANGIAVDFAGRAHIVGETDSTQASFPNGNGMGGLLSSDSTHNGAIDGFVAGVNAAGTALVYASYIGGIANDRAKGIAVDDNGDIYVTGETEANSVSFPVSASANAPFALDNSQNGGVDAFAMKICVTICNDLRVTQSDSPDPVRVGDNVTYTVTVANKGPDNATNVVLTDRLPPTVTLVSASASAGTCSGTTTITCALGSLANGASATVVIVAATTAKGTFNNVVRVVADETETRAADNEDSEQTVATLANLAVRALIAPAAASPGATISLQDTTQNSGVVGATSGTVTRFYLSSDSKKDAGDTILNARAVPPLAAKQSNTGSISATIPGGTALGRYFIIAVADDDASVVEVNERNQKNRRITVTRPDLKISSLRTPGSALAGASIAIQDSTQNEDLVDGGASVTKFYLSTDNLLDGSDILLGSRAVPALAARATSSATTNVTIPLGTVAGRYFVLGVADADAAIVESDEANNIRSRAITVK